MNLAFVKKQLAFAEGFVVPRTTGHVLGDVGIHQKRAAGLEVNIGIADVGLAFAESLDLGAVKNESRFHPFEDVIIVGGRAVLRDDLFARLLGVLALLGNLPGFTSWLGHNLSFYLMMRLIRVSGTAAHPGKPLPSYRPPVGGKAGKLANGTV